jgi:hypothetical protein
MMNPTGFEYHSNNPQTPSANVVALRLAAIFTAKSAPELREHGCAAKALFDLNAQHE